ncbi:hypothetical protein BSP36_226 [Bacillus phage BSP36]|uniref:Uncharacterized protein n=1 Tax=Bacillus phage Grass TaxID=1406785 RepID=U5PU89_BPGRA|nr:hypothetical protein Grass_225 [Bacillus phage Grass]AGY47490.1 hypothetical protein Grass_225 [Bacillus phage Grass]AYJ75313.1 hypothetical protein BSP36_226 [Bacillus phage BSP36]UPI13231.1 hypothetical protein [Bacillus phage SBSphiJ7]
MYMDSIVEEIKLGMPSQRILQVVSYGGVVVNGRLITLKNKEELKILKNKLVIPQEEPDSPLVYDTATTYNKPFEEADLEFLKGKRIIFGEEVFTCRGLKAIVKLSNTIRNLRYYYE